MPYKPKAQCGAAQQPPTIFHLGEVRPLITQYKPKAKCGAAKQPPTIFHLGEVRLLITPYKPKAQCGATQQQVTCVPKGRDNRENSYGVLRGWNKGMLLRAKPYGLSCIDWIPRRGCLSIEKSTKQDRFPGGDDACGEKRLNAPPTGQSCQSVLRYSEFQSGIEVNVLTNTNCWHSPRRGETINNTVQAEGAVRCHATTTHRFSPRRGETINNTVQAEGAVRCHT